MDMISEGSIGDVIVDEKKPARIAAVPVEANEVGMLDGGEDEDLVAEGGGGRGGHRRVRARMEALHGGGTAIGKVS